MVSFFLKFLVWEMDISFLATLTNLLLFGQAIINFMEANQSHAEMVKFLWCWIPNCSSEHRDESGHGQHVDSCPQSVAETQPAGQDPGGGRHLACLGLSIQVAHLYSRVLLNSQTCWVASSAQILGPYHRVTRISRLQTVMLLDFLLHYPGKKMTVLKWIVRRIYSLGLLNICSCAFH